jgi:hypothetical protein
MEWLDKKCQQNQLIARPSRPILLVPLSNFSFPSFILHDTSPNLFEKHFSKNAILLSGGARRPPPLAAPARRLADAPRNHIKGPKEQLDGLAGYTCVLRLKISANGAL